MSPKPKERQNTEPDHRSAELTNLAEASVRDLGQHEQIRIRAYEIYIARDGQPGDDLGDWLQAEREVESKLGHEERDK
jgi:hypothetical protein